MFRALGLGVCCWLFVLDVRIVMVWALLTRLSLCFPGMLRQDLPILVFRWFLEFVVCAFLWFSV